MNENIGALIPTYSRSSSEICAGVTWAPTITLVASSMKLVFSVFETNGKVRDARTFASITLTSFCFARNCMLNGPEMQSSFATWRAIRFTLRTVSTKSFCAGRMSVASPECTPAFSTCSEIA